MEVKPFEEGAGDQLDEVLVTQVVFAEEHKPPGAPVQPHILLVPRPGGEIDLAPDHQFDPRLLADLVQVDCPVHRSEVGDGDGVLPRFLHPAGDVLQTAGAV